MIEKKIRINMIGIDKDPEMITKKVVVQNIVNTELKK